MNGMIIAYVTVTLRT